MKRFKEYRYQMDHGNESYQKPEKKERGGVFHYGGNIDLQHPRYFWNNKKVCLFHINRRSRLSYYVGNIDLQHS